MHLAYTGRLMIVQSIEVVYKKGEIAAVGLLLGQYGFAVQLR